MVGIPTYTNITDDKIAVLKNYAEVTEKPLWRCQKVLNKYFSVNFTKYFKRAFLLFTEEYLGVIQPNICDEAFLLNKSTTERR